MTPEEKARVQIGAQLSASGWAVQDYTAADFSAGRGIALREVPLTTGPCDYLLLVDRKAVGVVEAKKQGTMLSTVAEQSGRYASSLPELLAAGLTGPLPFLYESTGIETFFRDERDPAPRSRRVFTFHRPETLANWAAEPDTLRRRLAQMPFAHPLATTGMRDCQVEAITGLEKSFAEDRPRALIHMATGAGKTYAACAFTYRLLKYARARRVLFLVDRANLGEQARDEFHRFRTPDTGRLITELYNVQHLASPQIDDVCKKITYQAKHPATGKPVKGRDLIREFCNATLPRVAVTVDMIATGTDIKPLEVLVFLRDVRSRVYFEQMKGRGTRVVTPTDLKSVSGEDARAKTRFVIVDAVGVCESDKTESRPLDREPTVPLKTLLQRAIFPGGRDEDTLTTLAAHAGQPDAAPFDLLCHLAFNAPVLTHRQRADRVKRRQAAFFHYYQPEAQEILCDLTGHHDSRQRKAPVGASNSRQRWERQYTSDGELHLVTIESDRPWFHNGLIQARCRTEGRR